MSRLDKALADYLAIAVSPVLIMTLVGSLVYFLLELFYQGQYVERLHFILTLFVIAAVLIGRIAITSSTDRAAMFAVPLAIVTALAIQRFVECAGPNATLYWIVNWSLLALTWWSTHKLTWDCTLFDETEDSTGRGLLETAQLGSAAPEVVRSEAETSVAFRSAKAALFRGAKGDKPTDWWQRCFDRRRRPHAPGVWIVYFSLAALPLFGVGQAFIPASQAESRRYAFLLLVVYTASGLGLLLLTSFLGLRRYLRQRRLQMPVRLAAVWIAIGCGLIVAVLLACAVLPRPSPEYSLDDLAARIVSPERTPSPAAVGREGPQAKKGTPQDVKPEENAKGEKAGSTERRAKNSEPKDDARKGPQASKSAEATNRSEASKPSPGKAAQPTPSQGRPPGQTEPRSSPPASPPPSASPPPPPQIVSWPPGLLTWAFQAILAAAAVYALWRWRREVLEALRQSLRQWREFWQRLWAKTRKRATAEDAGPNQPQGTPLAAFSAFVDPFAEGSSQCYTPEELVRYTFAALEAWARQRGSPRQPDQTPDEFARRLAVGDPPLAEPVRYLANVYAQAAYAPQALRKVKAAPLEELWRYLRSTTVSCW